MKDFFELVTPAPSCSNRFESASAQSAAISVLVSLYNYRNCIVETLDCLKEQTLQFIELVVVDDASTDGGNQLVEEWLKQKSQRERPNHGQPSTSNNCVIKKT